MIGAKIRWTDVYIYSILYETDKNVNRTCFGKY